MSSYAALSWAALRTPLLPADSPLVRDLDAAVADPTIRRALAIGCPDLLDALDRPTTRGRDAERARSSLARYLVRMSMRPTPYGAFAAVSLVSWADSTTVEVTNDRLRARPDFGWLLELLAELDADPRDRARARWRANPLREEQNGRLWSVDRNVSVRVTEPVRIALDAAREPVDFEQLRSAVGEATAAAPSRVDNVLNELWSAGLLLTDLRPTLTGPYSVERIVDLVRRSRPDLADQLTAIVAELHDIETGPPEAAPVRLRMARETAAAIHPVANDAVQVDLARALGPTAQLTRLVAAELAQTADVLLSMSPSPAGSNGLVAFARSFAQRYGSDAEVPLLDALNSVHGIGPMSHDHGANAGRQQERSDILMTLALTALRDRRHEIDLDDATVARLRTWSPQPERMPVSVELSAFVLAADSADVDAGRFDLVLGPNLGAPSAGRSLGRFADMLQPGAKAAYAELGRAEVAADPDTIPVEVVYLPNNRRSANVVLRDIAATHEIVIDCNAGVVGEAVLPLDDLWVSVDGERVVLRSERLNARIRPTARHMLNIHTAPAICQFLDEVARSGEVSFAGFEWGTAETLPFLPRVRRGRVVLAPARWLLPPSATLTAAARGERKKVRAKWLVELDDWRKRWDVPSRVYVTVADNRLLLDLDHPDDIEQLYREAVRQPGAPLRLQEALPDHADAWLPGAQGRFIAEIVVPLVRRHTVSTVSIPRPPAQRHRRRSVISQTARAHVPGTEWLFVKLYGPRTGEDGLLTGPLADLTTMTDESGLTDNWFFLRYADPEPHLRLRWKGDPDVLLRHVLPQVTSIASALVERGEMSRLVIDTYEREIERYGGPSALDTCEQIFHADSRAVRELLGLRNSLVDRTELAAVTADALLDALGLDTGRRLALYKRQAGNPAVSVRRAASDDYRSRKVRLIEMLEPGGMRHLDPGGDIATVVSVRDEFVRSATARLRGLEAQDLLTTSFDDIAASLLHMHLNRLIGGRQDPSELHVYQLLERANRSRAARRDSNTRMTAG